MLLRSAELTPSYGINPGAARWYAFNLLSEIDRPGEYYIDRGNGLLYFWPPSAVGRGGAVPFRRTGPGRGAAARDLSGNHF